MTLTQHNIQQYRTVVMAIMLAVMAILAAPSGASAHDGVDHSTDHEATAHLQATLAGDAAPKSLAGRILLDAGRNGEAWYVNPQTLQRISLGRPNAALEALSANGISVQFASIARLSETADGAHDMDYAKAVAGHILTPNDLVGASWYVHPSTHVRMRIATPADALAIMQTGTPVASRVIDAIGEQAFPEARVSMAKAFTEAETADTLVFADGSKVRLISVETPANPDLQAAAKALLTARLAAKPVLLEKDVKREAADGVQMRYVIAGGVNLSQDLIRNGLAFPNIAFPNYRYAEQLIVASIDAKNQKRGFWGATFQTTGKLN